MKTIIKDFKKLKTALRDSHFQAQNRLKNQRKAEKIKFKVLSTKENIIA